MTASEAFGMTDEAIQTELNKAFTSAAMCRQVVPLGPQEIGKEAVTYRPIAAAGALGPPAVLGPLTVATSVHLFYDFSLKDRELADNDGKVRAIQNAATQLGALEDLEIVQGTPAADRLTVVAGLARAQLNVPNIAALPRSVTTLPTPKKGASLGGADVLGTVVLAKAALTARNRAGGFGLLLDPSLLAQLDGYAPSGGRWRVDIERQIGTNEISGTSALSSGKKGTIGGILFRLQPDAVDFVHTLLPRLSVIGWAAGAKTFRVEEEVVLRILDQTAIQYIDYP